MRTLAVLPVKTFNRAKQRLGDALAPSARMTLAEAMVSDVLDALGAVAALDDVIVVTAEPLARAAARQRERTVIDDDTERGQSAATLLGIAAALEDGAGRVLLVPGDCPALDPAELEGLLARATTPVTIIPDRHGSGTNGLLLAPPDAIEPGFGPGSFARHAARARAAGHAPRVAQVPSLGLDVDTPDDLDALRAALAGRPGGAARTRAALEQLAAQAA